MSGSSKTKSRFRSPQITRQGGEGEEVKRRGEKITHSDVIMEQWSKLFFCFVFEEQWA